MDPGVGCEATQGPSFVLHLQDQWLSCPFSRSAHRVTLGGGALGKEVLFHRGQLLRQCGHTTS